MDDDQLRNFIDAVRRMTEAIDRTGDPLLDYRSQVDKAAEAAKKESEERKAALDKQRRVVANFASSVLSHTQRLGEGKGSFTALSGAIDLTSKALGGLAGKIPLVGGVFKGAVEGFAEGVKFMTGEFEKAYGVFEQLSDTGVIRTIEDLRSISAKTGLNFEDVNKVLGKNAKTFTLFGGSVQAGVERFERLSEESKDIRREFQRLGVNITDFGEYQLFYMQQLQLRNQLEGKTDQQLVEGTKDYILQLDALSKLTGKSRKELQTEIEERTRETKFAAFTRNMQKDQVDAINAYLANLPKQAQEGMKDIIASGAVNTEAARRFIQQFGETGLEQAMALRQGIIRPLSTEIPKMRAAAGEFTEKMGSSAEVIGDTRYMFQGYYELLEFARKTELKDLEQLKKEAAERAKNQESQTAALSDARTALYNASTEITLLATNSKTAAELVKTFGEAINGVVKAINNRFGTGPSGANINRDGAAGTAGSTGTQSYSGPRRGGTSAERQIANITQERLNTLLNGNLDNFNRMNADVRDNFLAMAQEYTAATGNKLQINSSFRTFSEQQRLYDQWVASGRTGNPVALPGTSSHELGRALDLQSTQVAALKSMRLLDKYRFKTLDNDPPHIYMKNGGIASGPMSGFPATLHGNEMVQPLDQNSILQKLATTPSNVAESDARTHSRQLIEETHSLTRKYDEMIKVLGDIRNIQKTLMMRTYA